MRGLGSVGAAASPPDCVRIIAEFGAAPAFKTAAKAG
jgi:hypothetical protein